MIIKASVYQVPAFETSRSYWVGESESLCHSVNCPAELRGIPLEFISDSKEEVIADMITVLKSKGISGHLRLI